MSIRITIELEVSEEEVLRDVLTILETTLPYIADNVVVCSEEV